jgi:ketosteroid isomerase-like protein
MKRTYIHIFIVFALAFAFHITGFAQSSDESETAVANLEKKYFEALENQDQELMSSLLDDDFVISSMTSDWSMNKEDFLKTIPKQDITSQEITGTKVEIKGDKAYSKVDISMTKTYKGKDHSGDYEVYSIWVNKDGNWKLVARKIKFINPPE